MISSNWKQLQINKAELEQAFEQNIVDEWAIAFSSVLYLKQRQASIKILSIINSFLFISLLLLFPINLIILRQFGLIDNSSLGSMLILLVSTGEATLLLIVFCFYLYKKAKRLKSMAILLKKVEQHNQLINSFNLLTNISAIANSQTDAKYKNTIKLQSVFNITKNILLESIKLESFVYRHYHHADAKQPHNSQQLLAHLESNLASLPFEQERNTEYQQMLDEAVDLGLSIRQEMRKIQNLRQTK